jgi:hypothetical protein
MPQTVQVTINFSIAPAPPPPPPTLVATPATATDSLTVGQPAPTTPLSVISGGTPPYKQPTVDPASSNPLPPGLAAAVDASGNLTVTGSPDAAGSGSVTLDIQDSGA